MKHGTKFYVANGAVLFVIGVGFIGFIKSVLTKDVIPPCNEQYANYLMFPENVGVGERISDQSIELHLDGDVQGLSAFTKVIYSNTRGVPVQFETRLPKGSNNPRREGGIIGGMGFSWQPGFPTKVTSACLSYKVWLPKDFKFAKGGTLPGLYGGDVPGVNGYDDPSRGFSASMVWEKNGMPRLRTFSPAKSSEGGLRASVGKLALPLGRWTKFSQEMILNSPGKKDGASRIWIDGALKYEAVDVMFSKNKNLNISGVLGDVYYEGRRSNIVAPKDTFLRITPFVLNWK